MNDSGGPPAAGRAPAGGIVLFDATCLFCEGAVRFIARRDPHGYFRFAGSNTQAAAALLAQQGLDGAGTRSLVLLEDGRAYLRSTASLRIARRLVWPWRLLGVFLIVPAPLRDMVYRIVAAVRHRIAGRSDSCRLPPPEIRARLL